MGLSPPFSLLPFLLFLLLHQAQTKAFILSVSQWLPLARIASAVLFHWSLDWVARFQKQKTFFGLRYPRLAFPFLFWFGLVSMMRYSPRQTNTKLSLSLLL